MGYAVSMMSNDRWGQKARYRQKKILMNVFPQMIVPCININNDDVSLIRNDDVTANDLRFEERGL